MELSFPTPPSISYWLRVALWQGVHTLPGISGSLPTWEKFTIAWGQTSKESLWQRTKGVPGPLNTIRMFPPWAASERCFSLMIESQTTQCQCEGDYHGKLLTPKHRGCLGEAWESFDIISGQILQPFPRNWLETLQAGFQRAPLCFHVIFLTDKLTSLTKIHVTCPSSVSRIIWYVGHFLWFFDAHPLHKRKHETGDC